MIRGFLGREHDVVTGVALVGVGFEAPREPVVFSVAAAVVFGGLSEGELEAYARSEAWRGKAGGYNLFDRRAAGWPVEVRPGADATAVVGLPMDRLGPALARWGILPEAGKG
jgi:septum formation protein